MLASWSRDLNSLCLSLPPTGALVLSNNASLADGEGMAVATEGVQYLGWGKQCLE